VAGVFQDVPNILNATHADGEAGQRRLDGVARDPAVGPTSPREERGRGRGSGRAGQRRILKLHGHREAG